MTIKLTKERLNELVKEVLEESYVASQRPSFQKVPSPQIPKEEKKEYKRDDLKVVRSLDEIPYSFNNDIDEPIILEINPFEPTPLHKHQESVKHAKTIFQKHYRSLSIDVRYDFERWLRKALIKNLSIEESQELVSRFSSAIKGNDEPKQINKKPS
jgi:hypothetical protein